MGMARSVIQMIFLPLFCICLSFGATGEELRDPVGNGKFCKVFNTGTGECNYPDLQSCEKAVSGPEEICLSRTGKKTSKQAAKRASKESSPVNTTLGRILQQFMPGQDCIDSRNLGYTIVAKIDRRHYEMRGDEQMFPAHALLETKVSEFSGTGHPLGISMHYVGEKSLKMSNGFDTPVDVWRECAVNREVGPQSWSPGAAIPTFSK